MSQVLRHAIVPYTPQQMYDLVADVDAYHAFLPRCTGSRLLEKNDDMLKGELTLRLGSIEQSFTTVNQTSPPHQMTMALLDGPFKSLAGVWLFERQGTLTKVTLDLNYQFKSNMLELAVGKVFSGAMADLVSAFERRAHEVYE